MRFKALIPFYRGSICGGVFGELSFRLRYVGTVDEICDDGLALLEEVVVRKE